MAPTLMERTRPRMAEATDDFLEVRERLLGIAGRICGSRAEAEDVVQDAWLRWQLCDREEVRNPTAFLVTATTRLAINVQQSARVRRERCTGDWSIEPSDAGAGDPWPGLEHDEVLGRGVRILMQRLAPLERAAFLLRHAFDYPYPRIAALLGVSEANARQVVSRAGRRLDSGRRHVVDASEHRRLVAVFTHAARSGDTGPLEAVLLGAVAGPAVESVAAAS